MLRAGCGLTDGCSKFSTENLSDTLKFFLSGLKTTKGIERNLFAKKFLSNIFYSPESIKIRFTPLENSFLTGVHFSPKRPAVAGRGAKPSPACSGAGRPACRQGRANPLVFKK
ncbi:hypothetical protein HYW53_03040 [Candidatus Giovannonibacteria bacterium]|nr:hypothetical protein [Candidatus Giovannonibacteria bacterium]